MLSWLPSIHALHRKGAFYLVSLKALAEEKYAIFRRFWTAGDEQILRTAITTGDRDFEDEGLSQSQVTFATYEKFYALIRDNPDLLSHVSLIVVDELQTLGDRHRGSVLEMLLTLVMVRNPKIQIIGLSAALPNVEEVATWLGAKACRSASRDIPLFEEVWTKTTVYSKQFGQGTDGMQQRPNPTGSVETLNIVSDLVQRKQTPIIVFCMTKPQTEALARDYAKIKRGSPVRKILDNIKQMLLFFTEGGPTGRSLMDVVDAGIAFHHSDLSPDERRVIEDRIRDGSIEVTYSTTTLGQGVNLPIATVVFDDVYRGWIEEFIDKREYINMAGRAGRRGLQDEKGTSVLICRTAKDRVAMTGYLSEETEQVESVLEHESLDTFLLNLVASSDASNTEELRTFIRRSFFGTRSAEKNPRLLRARLDGVPSVAEQLAKDGFIIMNSDGRYRPTSLGYVTSQKGISPQTALTIQRRVRVLAEALGRIPSAEFATAAQKLLPATLHLLLDSDNDKGPIYRDGSAAAFLDQHREKICLLRRYEDPPDPLLILQVAWVLTEWVSGTGYQNLCQPFRKLREGQIRQAAEHCGWMFDAAAAISRIREFGLDPRIGAHLSITARRLLFGIPEAGVAIAEVVRNRVSLGVELAGIGRGKIMDLLKAGYDDLTKIIEADTAKLAAIMRRPDQANHLKLGAALYVDRLSQSTLATHTIRSKKFACDEVVKRVYQDLGTQFEVAVCELLSAVGIKAELLDDRKTPGCADILLFTDAGNIQIECKTRAKGLVTNAEAFEVLGKTVVGPRPIAYVTVGKPGFVDLAVKNSYSSRVTLISHKIIAELSILVLEKKKSVHDLLGILQFGHHVEKSNLR